MTELDDAMARFAELPGAEIGRGPRHPSHPDETRAEEIEAFLNRYPRLRQDPSYVEFLEKYAGASLEIAEGPLLEVLGFSDASTEMEEMDGPIVSEQGFLLIAEAIYHRRVDGQTLATTEKAFAYDVTGIRGSGLFCSVVTGKSVDVRYSPSYVNFHAWLQDVIATKGWLTP
jgi:hypothetical protein